MCYLNDASNVVSYKDISKADFPLLVVVNFYAFMSVIQARGGVRGERGVNVNVYLSVCSKSVSRLTWSILDIRNYRTNK